MTEKTEFNHVIMTRFNLASPGRESAIRNQCGWLARRFELFERHCLPSVASQTHRNFDWIVYFDIDTPKEYRERIESCRSVFPFTPYFTPLFQLEGWSRAISESLKGRNPWLLTTRLDNDDAIASDFVERLRNSAMAAGQRTTAFNFTNGFVVADGRVYALTHRSNAFVSLLEPRDGSERTVMSIQHLDVERHYPIVQVDGPGAWVQMVHGGNVSNKIRGSRVPATVLNGRVPPHVVGQLVNSTSFEVGLENVFLTPLRNARDYLVYAIRRRWHLPLFRREEDGRKK